MFLEKFEPPTRVMSNDEDLFDVLGIEGDDADEFMDAFIARFDIDATAYRWYFHHADEGWNSGGLFFKPIYRRVERVPITVAILTEAVRTGRWPVVYPEHVLPRRRWDILINQVFVGLTLSGLIVWGWMSLVR